MSQNILVLIHIVAGTIGLLSGVAAVSFRKGSKRHKYAGLVFLISMLLLFLSGSWVAFIRSISLSLANGILASYLVATGWMAMKQPAQTITKFDRISLFIAVFTCGMLVLFAIEAANSESGKLDGFSAPAFIFFALIAALSSIGDIRMIIRGGVSGKDRVLRHLWRMFFPFFMATAAVFLGQAKIFPGFMQNIFVLVSPVVLVVITMIYWALKVQFSTQYKNMPV